MERIAFDYSKLRGRIKEKCDSQKVFAERLGVSEATLISKLKGHSSFSQDEIFFSANILDISMESLDQYFFTRKVQ